MIPNNCYLVEYVLWAMLAALVLLGVSEVIY